MNNTVRNWIAFSSLLLLVLMLLLARATYTVSQPQPQSIETPRVKPVAKQSTSEKFCEGRFDLFGDNILEEIETVKDCNIITGGLFINSTNLRNLDFLASLTTVNSLYLAHNYQLTDISALARLKTIDLSLTIKDNDVLQNLSGLDNLESIGNALMILDNDSLVNLQGLEKMRTLPFGLDIEGNKNLTNLSGLDNLHTIGFSLNITNNSSLSSLSTLKGISTSPISLFTYDKLQIKIRDNPALTNLVGLERLTVANGETEINSNISLDCSPYNSEPFKLAFFPVYESTGNLVDCKTE